MTLISVFRQISSIKVRVISKCKHSEISKSGGGKIQSSYQPLYSFQCTALFLYPMKTSGSLMFSGGTERDQWPEMG